MRTKSFFLSFVVLFVFVLTLTMLPQQTQAATQTLNLEKHLALDKLHDVHTLEVINNTLYLIDHFNDNGTKKKQLFRLDSSNIEDLDLALSGEALLRADDRIIEFNDAIYTTFTQVRGERIKVFRSTDDGVHWEQVANIGFNSDKMVNKVLDAFVTTNRLYVVLEPKNITDSSIKKTIHVWSTEDGTRWDKNVIEGVKPNYAGYAVLEDVPYVFINGKRTSRVFSPSQPDGHEFEQVTYTNLRNTSPIRKVQQVVPFKAIIFIQGLNMLGGKEQSLRNQRSLRSTNALTWRKVGHRFSEFAPHKNSLFAQIGNDIFLTTDGLTFTPITLNFENDYTIAERSLHLFSSADRGLLTAQFTDNAKQKTCLVSKDAVTWLPIEGCAVIDRPEQRQTIKLGNYWYFVRGRENHPLVLSRISFQ